MHEIGTNVPLIVCGFHTKWGKWDTFSFFEKKKIQSFISEILRVVSLLGEKFILLPPWDLRIFKLSVYTHVVRLENFSEHFELFLCFKYSRSYEVL